ncbi:putative DNA binding domain-containing protein [Sulfurimonas sp. SWIR-19]|uniref:ATP-binding protein n=1 Tax=Sulfurimonas sp. SWIR-19 TaxID=2878390 RepID=UPI001CF28714|nr:ATP-binding protein [Sulfurimonas sp. SWIR-19]UCN01377.1 putative DNA binding domain-containing protein [Sulfurimonas sp. SWIR-19]
MTKQELQTYLQKTYPKENESCEWKEFKSLKNSVAGRKGEDIISYVSAIANMEGGNLVLGVTDKTLEIVGIDNFADYTVENLPHRILGNCTNLNSEGLEVEELIATDTNHIVWVIHVPKHLPRKPVYAHKTAWQRKGDSLIEMTSEREKSILNESIDVVEDWSANIIPNATINDLSQEAIAFARVEYKKKHGRIAHEVDEWSDEQFLDKAKLTIQGNITNTTLLLLGKDEASYLLLPLIPRMTWVLKDADNIELSYEHFGLPLLLSAKKIHDKIRNFKYRYMADDTLFPEEVDKYDNWILYEALHNSIAHQDYELVGKINVVEFPDKLVISNLGTFLAGDIESVISKDVPPERYRNTFLCTAMVEINMIDTIGSGIKRIFSIQKKRLFPMPDYDIDNGKVQVTIYGKILDERYTKLLSLDQELSLMDVIYLDRIVKKQYLDSKIISDLRSKRLIEGRKPNIHISLQVAKKTGQSAEYTKLKGIDDDFVRKMITDHLTRFIEAKRSDFEEILIDKLPDVLDIYQKKNKIKNNLQALKKLGIIENQGKVWRMSKTE